MKALSFPCKLFQSLFLRETADEQFTVLFGDNVSVKSLDDNLLFLRRVYDAVPAVKEAHVFTYHRVAVDVMLCLCKQRPPCA